MDCFTLQLIMRNQTNRELPEEASPHIQRIVNKTDKFKRKKQEKNERTAQVSRKIAILWKK